MTPTQWDQVAQNTNPSWYLDPLVALQKREEHLACARKWWPASSPKRVLKTDLFEEAYGQDSLLPDLFPDASMRIAMDVATTTVRNARAHCDATPAFFLTADVRSLPIRCGSIDLIFSNSTLDHFKSGQEFHQAIGELARVLRPGGRLIITLDNPYNPLYHPIRWASRLRLVPFFLGYTTSQSGLAGALTNAGLRVLDEGVLIHNPRVVATFLFLALRRLMGVHAVGPIRFLLRLFSRLGHLPTRKMTACFISACAEKPLVSESRRSSS
jgi:SAM-dependent methyltransferase